MQEIILNKLISDLARFPGIGKKSAQRMAIHLLNKDRHGAKEISCSITDALETINNWYDKGHIICFFTARIESHREVTEKWLKDNGFKYHSLLMGKPRGGNYHWIDNHLVKATRYNGKFTDLIEKTVTIEVFDDEESNK